MSKLVQVVLIALGIFALAVSVSAAPAHKLISKGNEAYESGQFDEALIQYDKASAEAPDLAEVNFNKGAAHYQKADYKAAAEAFQDAAIHAKFPELASQAKYNLGNCAFREAEALRQEDIAKAIESCRTSLEQYQAALRLNPELTNAAENIEIVRLYIKTLLDEQQKQQEEQQQQENLGDKLKELLKRQQDALAQSQQLLESKTDTQPWKDEVKALEGDQSKLQEDTARTLAEMQQMAEQVNSQQAQTPGQAPAEQQQMAEKLSVASQHVGEAINEQAASLAPLREELLDAARPHQREAAEELEKALEALADPNQDQQEQQQGEDQQQQQQGEEPKEQEGNDDQTGEEQKQEDGGEDRSGEQEQQQQQEQAQMEQGDQTARDILDEEKENQQRRVPVRFGVRAVDKDW